MREFKDMITPPDEIEAMVKENHAKKALEELRNAIILTNKIIRDRAEGGHNEVCMDDNDVQELLRTMHFVNWGMITKQFRDAGYVVKGERYTICLADLS